MRNICLPTSSEFVMPRLHQLISNQIGNPTTITIIIIIIVTFQFLVCFFLSTIWHFGQFLLISEHFLYILRSIVHADFWLLLFCIIFSASLPEISIFKTLTLLVRTIQHKPLTETLRFLSAFSFEFYEFRLQKLFFSPFVVLFSIEAKKSFVAFLVVFWQTGNRNKILLRCG